MVQKVVVTKLGDNLTLQDGKLPLNPNKPPPAMLKGVKKIRIILEDNENIPPTGLFIGWNGKTYMLKTGVEVDVPMPLIEILNNAVVSVPIVNPDTLQVMGSRNRMRFPYRLVNPVQEAA